MTKEDFYQLIQQGEHQRLEFKKASDALPNSVWETYAAFANTDGGNIILGVNERRRKFIIEGVTHAKKIIKEFWNQINNRQKVSLNILFEKDVSAFIIDNKIFILIQVPRANRQEKPIYLNNNILMGTYRRNFEGDYRCKETEIKAMLRDQAEISADLTVFEEIRYSEILSDTFRRYRIRFNNLKPGHVWANLSDEEFLLKIGALRRIQNKIFSTLAGVLMFCEEAVITSVLPQFFLDYREKEHENDLHWIDRIYSSSGNWSGNLFDFYFKVSERILESS